MAESNTSQSEPTTIFHVTHPKAGSQWIYAILSNCVPDRVVAPEIDAVQILNRPVQPGGVYPVLFLTRAEFDSIPPQRCARRFVIIRDLRDILVSLYYSIRLSHPIIAPWMEEGRRSLDSMPLGDGLLLAMDEWLPACGRIQESWLGSSEQLIRYEDLLTDDLAILKRVLLDECGLPVAPERFREIVLTCRFENLTGGRARGSEEQTSHLRKGISGGWRGHFTDRMKEAFKARFGKLLIATGYERDLSW